MRKIFTATFLCALALGVSSASAATGHWVCTADGIKSWTANMDTMDAKGWTYSGDRSAYRDGGGCKKS